MIVIAIAHRLSTMMDMDRLIVLVRGNIVADGPHHELLREGGLYAELWRRQSGGFNPVTRKAQHRTKLQSLLRSMSPQKSIEIRRARLRIEPLKSGGTAHASPSA